jgi:hypothetical protein
LFSSGTADDSPPALYEQSLDRIACALGGRAVLPPAFKQIPSMLAMYDYRARHAGISIVAIAEGIGKVKLNELGKIIKCVFNIFRLQIAHQLIFSWDRHPDVQ